MTLIKSHPWIGDVWEHQGRQIQVLDAYKLSKKDRVQAVVTEYLRINIKPGCLPDVADVRCIVEQQISKQF